jgi:hypothetical protein
MLNHCPFMAGRLGYLRLERFAEALADVAACAGFSGTSVLSARAAFSVRSG